MNISKQVEKVLSKLKETYPETKISLNFRNVYELLVSTMLSAQSTDEMVNKVTPDLFRKFPDILSLSKATIEDVIPFIKSIGLYNTKSKSLMSMAQQVMKYHEGQIPNTMKELVNLPGVGRKTANVVMGNGFGIKDTGITVDTHVTRIAQRLGWTENKTAIKIEKDLMDIVPKSDWVEITHFLISHGRATCTARKPSCKICTIQKLCPSAFEFD